MSTSDMESERAAADKSRRQRPVLVITSEDLPAAVRGAAIAAERGERILGGSHDDGVKAIFDAIPGIVAQKLQRITPPTFTLAEVTIEMALDISIPGFDMGGTVTLTLQPKK